MARTLGISAPGVTTATTPQAGKPFGVGTPAVQDVPLGAEAGQLPEALQDIARKYVAARRRTGEALLDMARWLWEARQQAKHGEWGVFLEATATSDDMAERLINTHVEAMQNPRFAENVARNLIGSEVAGLLSRRSTPPEVREQLLDQAEETGEAITVKQARMAIQEAKAPTSESLPNPWSDAPELPEAPDGWKWRTAGIYHMLIGPDGYSTRALTDPQRVLDEARDRIGLGLGTPPRPTDNGQYATPEGWRWLMTGPLLYQLASNDGRTTNKHATRHAAIQEAANITAEYVQTVRGDRAPVATVIPAPQINYNLPTIEQVGETESALWHEVGDMLDTLNDAALMRDHDMALRLALELVAVFCEVDVVHLQANLRSLPHTASAANFPALAALGRRLPAVRIDPQAE